jgi:hypothetical protein
MDDDITYELLQRLARRDQGTLVPQGSGGRINQSPGAPRQGGGIDQSVPRLPEQQLFDMQALARLLARMRTPQPQGVGGGGGHASGGGGQTSIGGEFD